MSPNSDHENSLERPPTPVEQAALGWVVRSERGLDAEQEREFSRWLAADPHHRELFAEFSGTWQVVGRLASEASGAGKVATFTPSAVPLVRPAVNQSRGTWFRRNARPVWLSVMAAAAVAIAWVGDWRPAYEESAVTTEIGASRRLTLRDGSVIELNTDSAIVAAFTSDERRVRLERGEAYFQVAKDAARPFIVEAEGVGVRAVGTAFNVRVHATSVEVLVTEGKVRVSSTGDTPATSTGSSRAASAAVSPGPTAEVRAGERVRVPVAQREQHTARTLPVLDVAPVPTDELQRRLSWQGGRLDFSDTPLTEMAAEFNRYNRHKLAVDPSLGAMRFGGSFRPDDRAGFVRMLQEHFNVVAEERDGQTLLQTSAPSNPR